MFYPAYGTFIAISESLDTRIKKIFAQAPRRPLLEELRFVSI